MFFFAPSNRQTVSEDGFLRQETVHRWRFLFGPQVLSRCFDYPPAIGYYPPNRILSRRADNIRSFSNKTLQSSCCRWEKKFWVYCGRRSSFVEYLWYSSAHLCTDHCIDYPPLSAHEPDYPTISQIIRSFPKRIIRPNPVEERIIKTPREREWMHGKFEHPSK